MKRTRLPADSAKVSLSMAGQVEHLLNGTCGTWSCLEKACPHVVYKYIYIFMFIGKLLSLWYWMGINGHQHVGKTCQNKLSNLEQLRTKYLKNPLEISGTHQHLTIAVLRWQQGTAIRSCTMSTPVFVCGVLRGT